jgi:hypothetical protein
MADQNAAYEKPEVVRMPLEAIGREYDLVAFNAIRVKYFLFKVRIAGCDMYSCGKGSTSTMSHFLR